MSTYRNRRLLALAKEAPYCMRCHQPNIGQVVAAHANLQTMGKGTGLKAADIPAYLCRQCHDELDGRVASGMGRKDQHAEWALAAIHSMRWALENHPEVFQ